MSVQRQNEQMLLHTVTGGDASFCDDEEEILAASAAQKVKEIRARGKRKRLTYCVVFWSILFLCIISGAMYAFPDHWSWTAFLYRNANYGAWVWPWPQSKKTVSVAIIGGGMAGVSTAYSLKSSNVDGLIQRKYEFDVYEKDDRIGGHSHTFMFKLANGTEYPVDLAYAYNPSMKSGYSKIRGLERKHNIAIRPLHQHISLLANGKPISNEQSESFDKECDRWMEIVQWCKDNDHCSTYYGVVTLRLLLNGNGLSMAFFTYRLYPVIRFVIVAGSKGKLLDAPAYAAIQTYKTGWGSCYGKNLHGNYNWFSIAGGSKSHIDAMVDFIGEEHFHVNSEVSSVRREGEKYKVVTNGLEKTYDAVVMCTPPDISADILGPQGPSWLKTMTTENSFVVLHSDQSILDPNVDPKEAVFQYRVGDIGDPAGAALTVLWSNMHKDDVGPKIPLVTTGNLEMYPAEKRDKFDGEVYRKVFNHVHMPTAYAFLRVNKGREVLSYKQPLEFASAWITFAYCHPCALDSGDKAARRLGAKYDKSKHWREFDHDPDGWEDRVLNANGAVPK